MKRLLSIWIICLFVVHLTACSLNNEEKKLYLTNCLNDSIAEIKVNAEIIYFNNTEQLAFQSNLSIKDMKKSLEELNPDYSFEQLDEHQIVMTGSTDFPYILFSKNVIDDNGKPVNDVYVTVSESCKANIPQDERGIYFPYHLANTHYTFSSQNDEFYSLKEETLLKPFSYLTELRASTDTFSELVKFYENCGYKVIYEGGNLTGGNICVYSEFENALYSPTPLFQILVMKNENKMAMQYCAGKDYSELKATEAVVNYFEALNRKSTEEFLNCFKEIDNQAVDAFLNNVKSCSINKIELFWMDPSSDEVILKVDRTLVSEDGKQMGSLGTGEVDCNDYWLVKLIDGEPKIICQYGSFSDTVSELTVYKEFEKIET